MIGCKSLFFLLAALTAAAGALQAQVAAPRLNPATPSAAAPFNPAVLSWAQASRLGLAYAPGVEEELDPGISSGSGDAFSAQWWGVGQTFAVAVETGTVSLDLTSPPYGAAGTRERTGSLIALSLRIGQSLSAGLGLQSAKVSDSLIGDLDQSRTLVGGVWKLGDAFFLGGTYGAESGDTNVTAVDASGDRSVTQVGAGWYARKGPGGYHVELYYESAPLLELSTAGVPQYGEESTTTGVTLEAVFSSFLIGLESRSGTKKTFVAPGTLDDINQSRQVLSLGWVPEKGFAIVLNARHAEDSHSSGSVYSEDATELAVSWQF